MTPSELWAALKVSKQGAMDLLRPLVKVGLLKRVGAVKKGDMFWTKRQGSNV